MILKGNSRANGQELARHLLNVEDNEHANIHELRGFLADDLFGAFREAEAVSHGTKCEQYLFSLSLNPPISALVSVEEFETAISTIETRLGLSGQPRAIVFHEKKGRRHAHCVWSRIDLAKMQAVNLPYFKRRLMDISRELYLEQNWEMPAGLHNSQDRNPNNYCHAEAGQAKRVKRDPERLKEFFRSCWVGSDSKSAFENALLEQGFCVARGDRRGFVAVDAEGDVYSLSRWCGIKSKELGRRLGDGSDLPDVEEATASLADKPVRCNDDLAFKYQEQAHKVKIAELVARQRAERKSLSDVQEVRRLEGIKLARARLPTGVKAAWARITGAYQQQMKELARVATERDAHAKYEMQALIDRHLSERRALDHELDFLKAQFELTEEYRRHASDEQRTIYFSDPRQPLILPREDVPFTATQLKRQPGLILDHITTKQARFSRNDLVRRLSNFIGDPLELRTALDQALASKELVRLEGDAEFTTKAFQATEIQLNETAEEMARLGGFRVKTSHIRHAIKRQNARLQQSIGADLSDEQVEAIRHILGPQQLTAVVGLAGTGKSTLLTVAREAWEQQGYRVLGAALAGKAADSLQSASGIPSRTLASLEASWNNGYEPIGTGDVVVIDEAGMVGTRQLARVTEQLQQRGCKLVMIGDPDQLQPIEAGNPFRDLVDKLPVARLSEIRRQKVDWQRIASRDLASGHIKSAMQNYADQGAVHEGKNRDEAIAALVDDYVAHWRTHGETKTRLALTHRRKDVYAINQAIRSARKAVGKTSPEVLFETDYGPRAFVVGDRMLFTRNDHELGVRNGMLGTVKSVGDDKLTIQIDMGDSDEPRTMTFSPSKFHSFDHGYAVTIHRSQGCTVDNSFVLSSRTLDKNLTYVAMTRHRENAKFYTALEITHERTKAISEVGTMPGIKRRRIPSRSR